MLLHRSRMHHAPGNFFDGAAGDFWYGSPKAVSADQSNLILLRKPILPAVAAPNTLQTYVKWSRDGKSITSRALTPHRRVCTHRDSNSFDLICLTDLPVQLRKVRPQR